MGNEIRNEFGMINIAPEVIAALASKAAHECFGVVGMQNTSFMKIFSADKGVEVKIKNNEVSIVIQIFVTYGAKIPEIAKNVLDSVTYSIKQSTDIAISNLEVKVAGVKVID